MATMNLAILVGHLGQDPKYSVTQSGNPVANLSIATSTRLKGKDDQWTDKTEWHRVTAWGKDAEFCDKFLTKGALVLIEGRIETRKWQDKDGADRYSTEIIAHRVQGLGKWRESGAGPGHGSNDYPPEGDPTHPRSDFADGKSSEMDDIPF